jgi:pimeloyl-ACP methyl ester carboxylesterase
MHTLPIWLSGSSSGGWPSRRSARPARARSLRLTRSFGRPSNRPDHSAEGDTDQRKLLVVGQRPIPLLRVVSFTETAHRRFRCGTVHDRQRVQVVAMGCTDGGSVTLCEADRVDRWNVTPVTPRIHRVTLLSCARPFDTELSAGFDGLSDVTQGAVVFVHGIISSPAAWTPLARLLENDTKISHSYRLLRFEYRSPKFDWRPDRRIPDYNTIADSLSTFIDIECADYTHLVLVGHSQGGLIVQRYLARMLAEGRGVDLRRIRRIVLLACPNNGSELLLILRKSARFWTHPQERELRPLVNSVVEAQRRVLRGIVFATRISPTSCPIPFSVYAGEADNVVTPASANGVFPQVGALPGDHNSILQAKSTDSRTFTTLRAHLLAACTVPESAPNLDLHLRQRESSAPSVPHNRNVSSPIIRVTTTTIQNQVTESQEIEIFDFDVASAWIQNRDSPLKEQGHRDGASDVK